VSATQYCVNCKHHYLQTSVMHGQVDMCRRLASEVTEIDLVTGRRKTAPALLCSSERERKAVICRCGPGGKFYEKLT
jgi:hypothetical protein